MKALHMVAFVLLVIGGLNWGLVGLGQWMGGSGWNVVSMIFGQGSMLESLVYVLVGLSAIWIAIGHKSACKMCGMGSSGMGM